MEIIDIHSHILPGADDGSQAMRETLEMLRIAEEEGITGMFATPHYQSGRWFTDTESLKCRLQEVREEAFARGISVALYPGTEIFYRSYLENRLAEGSLATMNFTDHILLEFAPLESFLYFRNAIEDIMGMGYVPIIAHVERYQCLLGKPERVMELKDMGSEIQCNAGSVTGANGIVLQHFVHKLLRQRSVDYIGTDAHNTERRSPKIRKCRDIIVKKYGTEYAQKVLGGNARLKLLGV